MKGRATGWLKELEESMGRFGRGSGDRKVELLRALEKARLNRSHDVARLHDVLCFLRAYPDDARVLARVESMLDGFSSRSDLRRFRDALENSGIAGTTMRFAFFPETATWLARRWGEKLTINWEDFEKATTLEEFLAPLALYSETPGIDNIGFELREWIDRLGGPGETDAGFLLKRLEQMQLGPREREALLEHLDIPLTLAPGADTPARGREKLGAMRTVYQSKPLHRSRPNLKNPVAGPAGPPRVLTERQGRSVVDLVRGAMVARERDLDAFAYADPKDVMLVDCGGGMRVAFIGVIPERRFLLETLYGFVVLRNGVPIGYGTFTALFGSAEVAFTIFSAFRAGEAAQVYGRLISIATGLFQCDAFTIHPGQIGQDNDDAIRSGAWWFYQKMGFRPLEAKLARLMRREEKRMKARPKYRSSPATLRELSSDYLCLFLGRRRRDVIGVLPLGEVGLRITDFLARRFGYDRETAREACAREAAKLLGVGLGRLSEGERLAWERWSPLILILPRLARWPAADKRELVAVVRAKGGRSEIDFLRRFNGHARLRRAIVALTKG